MQRKRLLTAVPLLAIAGMLVTSCGSGSGTSNTSTGSSSTTAAESSSTSAENPSETTEASESSESSASSAPVEFPPVKIRMETPVSEDSPWSQIVVHFRDAMAERTNGSFEVELFTNLQLSGDNATQFENIQNGTVHGAVVNNQPLTAFDERLNVFSLPFIAKDREQYLELLDGPGKELWADSLAGLNVHGITSAVTMDGFRQLTTNSPVHSPADLKGLTIRTPLLPLYIDIFKAMGANPVSLPFGELAGSLQTGVVDGQENPLATIKAGGFASFQTHLTLWNYSNSAMVFAFNQDTWDGFGPELQAIVEEEAANAISWHRESVIKTNDEILEEFKSSNAFDEFTTLTEDELKEFRNAMATVVEDWRSKLGAETVDPFLKFYE